MKTQSILPVITEDLRILGWVTLDSPTLFVGNETTVTVSSKSIPIQKFSWNRVRDQVPIELMGAPVTLLQERQRNWNTYPNFGNVSDNTPVHPWMQTGSTTIEPKQRGDRSALQILLDSF